MAIYEFFGLSKTGSLNKRFFSDKKVLRGIVVVN